MGKPRKDFRHTRLTDQLLNFFLANPDEELTYEDIQAKFSVSSQVAYNMVTTLRRRGADLESTTVVRLKRAGVAA